METLTVDAFDLVHKEDLGLIHIETRSMAPLPFSVSDALLLMFNTVVAKKPRTRRERVKQ